MHAQYSSIWRTSAMALFSVILGACGGGGGGDGGRAPQSLVFVDSGGTPALYLTRDDGSASAYALSNAGDHGRIGVFKRSPDARWVAYTADDGMSTASRLYLANSDGSGVTLLSGEFNNADAEVLEFHWSPEGTRLIFLADGETANKYELYSVTADGAAAPTLISGSISPSLYDIRSPGFSPDGRYVSYLVTDNNRAIGLNIHDTQVGGRDSTRVSQPALDSQFPAYADIARYAWSPDGSRLAYRADTKSDAQYEIFTVNPDGTAHALGNGNSGGAVYIGDFGWSADGRYIGEAVRRLSDNSYVGLNVWDVEAQSGVRVADASDYIGFAWSHGGARLAFGDNHEDTSGPMRLYVYAPETAALTGVAHGGDAGESVERFAFSPNDASLAYVTGGGLYAVQGDFTSASIPLYTLSATQSIFLMVWSPGSDRLAFASNDSTTLGSDLYSVAVRTDAAAVRLTEQSLDARVSRLFGPYWSNDGERLVFSVSRRTTVPSAYIQGLAPDAGARVQLSETYLAFSFEY